RPDDTLVFISWEAEVSDFYWKARPPAHVFVTLDPRLYAHKPGGSLYWVIYHDPGAPPPAARDTRWAEVARFESVVVLREDNPDPDMASAIERIMQELGGANNSDRTSQQGHDTMFGTIYQSRGEIEKAAHAYLAAGTYYPIGDEYLRA